MMPIINSITVFLIGLAVTACTLLIEIKVISCGVSAGK